MSKFAKKLRRALENLPVTRCITTNNPILYAEHFSKVKLEGTRWLAFRDVPQLTKKYVKGHEALDYGCGPGFSTLFLKSLGFLVDGVDINEHMINLARKEDPNGNYALIRSGSIPTPDNHYDLVFCSWVLLYISTKQELRNIVEEIARVLKENGVAIIITTSDDTYLYEWLTFEMLFEENKNFVSGSNMIAQFRNNPLMLHCYFWSEADHVEIFNEAGFDVLCTHKPLGNESDGYEWKSENEKNISNIYVIKKR